MLRNYLIIAVRNLLRHKSYSAINILGLAVGMAFCILTFLFVRNEWTYDTFHENAGQIYRVYRLENDQKGERRKSTEYLTPMAPALAANFPEIRRAVRIMKGGGSVNVEGKVYREGWLFVDPAFFEMFTFPLRQGDPRTALRDKSGIVISAEMARKYFGDESPIGKRMSLKSVDFYEAKGAVYSFVVTGVAQPAPSNSTIRFDILIPYENVNMVGLDPNSWDRSTTANAIYIQLQDHVQASDLEIKFPLFVQSIQMLKRMSQREGYALRLQPLTDIHFNSTIWGPGSVSNPKYSYILSGISLLVLLIACVNFVNMAVGQSATRAREVGVRKVVGAGRMQLMRQFWGESVLISFIALFLGIALAELMLPAFNGLTVQGLSMAGFVSGPVLAFLVGLTLFVGLAAGSYPALVLSGFHTMEVLNRRLKVGGKNLFGRSLVVLQFALSIFFIVSAAVMFRQVRFLKAQDLGFNTDQIVAVKLWGLSDREKEQALGGIRNELSQYPNVVKVSWVTRLFNQGSGFLMFLNGEYVFIAEIGVDHNYLDMMGLKVIEGQTFSERIKGVLVNEALVKTFGWDTAIGQRFKEMFRDSKVIGVVKNFHHESLHQEIRPAILYLTAHPNFLLVKIRPQNIPATLDLLKAQWRRFVPDLPFDFFFLDDYVNQQYQAEERWGRIIGYSAAFAIFIACLGAFGLTSLAVARRTKEVGIRKVLGASVSSIVMLLSKEFVVLVGVANLIAWPVAYYAMNRWLRDFAYRIELEPWVFALGGILALIVALLTVGVQAFKAATANPVDALRYE
jgi:putative ABC transport system permease protein